MGSELRVARTTLEVEEPMGPGIAFEPRADGWGLVGRRARTGGVWLGADRAALPDSDDGHGRRQPVLVALPASSFAGCQLEADLVGGFDDGGSLTLVAQLPGASLPIDGLLRTAGRISETARRFGPEEAARVATASRRRFRERRSHNRITGGVAWRPPEELALELARQSSIHSRAERSLASLPPRFIRGLEGILDPDERLLYSIERPWRGDAGLLGFVRGGYDGRAALLVLTDRQLLWMIDHANPDSFLSDWGVDIELVPLEQLSFVRIEASRGDVALAVASPGGRWTAVVPRELEADLGVMEALLRRFLPEGSKGLPRRQYEVATIPFRTANADLFGQGAEAAASYESATAAGDVLAFLFSPRREGQRRWSALYVAEHELGILGDRRRTLSLDDLSGVGLVLSPLVGRIHFRSGRGDLGFTYPAPLGAEGAALVRLVRRLWANRSGVRNEGQLPSGAPLATPELAGARGA